MQTSYQNAPIHEHDFRVIAGIENVTGCLTWNVYFCRLCGKRVNHAQIHTDRLACEKRKDRERENRIKITTHAIQLQSESKRHARNYIGITNARNCGNQIPNDCMIAEPLWNTTSANRGSLRERIYKCCFLCRISCFFR